MKTIRQSEVPAKAFNNLINKPADFYEQKKHNK